MLGCVGHKYLSCHVQNMVESKILRRLYYTLSLLYYYINNRTRNDRRIMERGDGQMPKRLVGRR